MVDKARSDTLAALRANGRRRQRAEAQLEADRRQLGELLAAGREAGLTITQMAAAAGVTRETAYQTMRRGKQ